MRKGFAITKESGYYTIHFYDSRIHSARVKRAEAYTVGSRACQAPDDRVSNVRSFR